MDLGLLLEFEFMNGRSKTGCGLSWILENDTIFRNINQLIERASGLFPGLALSMAKGRCKMEMAWKRSRR